MNARIRAYVIANMVMNGLLAFATLFRQDTFKAPSYENVFGIIPIHFWGYGFAALFLVGLWAQVRANVALARTMFVVSAAFLATWAVGFLLAYMQGKALGPTGFIIWGTLAAYNTILVSTPGISRLERYVDTHSPSEVLRKHLNDQSLDR